MGMSMSSRSYTSEDVAIAMAPRSVTSDADIFSLDHLKIKSTDTSSASQFSVPQQESSSLEEEEEVDDTEDEDEDEGDHRQEVPEILTAPSPSLAADEDEEEETTPKALYKMIAKFDLLKASSIDEPKQNEM